MTLFPLSPSPSSLTVDYAFSDGGIEALTALVAVVNGE